MYVETYISSPEFLRTYMKTKAAIVEFINYFLVLNKALMYI
jgi:hypothetical protein